MMKRLKLILDIIIKEKMKIITKDQLKNIFLLYYCRFEDVWFTETDYLICFYHALGSNSCGISYGLLEELSKLFDTSIFYINTSNNLEGNLIIIISKKLVRIE